MNQHNLDKLRESMVRILNPAKGETVGSGFIIRDDGYLVTCHHVIYLLDALKVEYQGQEYEAQWCEDLSDCECDIAILKINVENAKAIKIINPRNLSTSVTVYGFPPSEKKFFPEGINFSAQTIRPSAPVNILPTYATTNVTGTNPWNKLPQPKSTFLSHRINTQVKPGTSGGPVFAEELGGVVGVIQCSKSDESYVIRWDNITVSLDKLGLAPEKTTVCNFLAEIANDRRFKFISLFHTKQQIELKAQYIPIQVTLETKRKDVESFLGYGESDVVDKRVYALKGFDDSQKTQIDWEEAKKQCHNQDMMVLADPGMGKSTLLKMETITTAKKERDKLLAPHPNLPTGVDEVILPLFLRLSDLDEKAAEIIEAIPLLIQRDYPQIFPEIEHLLKEKLNQGKCLLLLDALDEVPKENRIRLQEKLNRFSRNYPCSIICTSRIVGYGGGIEGGKEVEIVPFGQKQTAEYIETWFKNAEGYIQDESVSAENLIQQLRDKPQIAGLAQNPLLLSLLCSLYQEKNLTLPAQRTQVYQKAVDYMLRKWSAHRHPQSEGMITAKIRLLEKLAYDFSCDDEQDGSEIFSFDELHSAIEGYFRLGEIPTDLRNYTPSNLIEELSAEDGILQKWDREGDKYLFLHRTFQEYFTATYLLRKIKENHKEGISLVKKLFWQYDAHETLILLAGLMENPLPLLQAITQAEDDIFKTLLLLAGRCLAECKKDVNFNLAATNPLIGKIIEGIHKFWRNYPKASFIESTVLKLGEVNSKMLQKVIVSLNDSKSRVRRYAAEALGNIGNSEAVNPLIAALNDSDSDVRSNAVKALGKIGNSEAVNGLIAALNHSKSRVRRYAAEALGNIGNSEAVNSLIAALKDSDSEVRSNAAKALGYIGNSEAVNSLIATLNHSNSWVRRYAAEALGKIGNSEAVNSLIVILKDSNSLVRINAAKALGYIGNSEAVNGLIAALNHSNSLVRINAAWALGKIGNSEAVNGLIAALNDSDSLVRSNAAWALGKIGNSEAVNGLIAALNHSDSEVRIYAALASGKIGNSEAVNGLIAALNHSDSEVRSNAAKALGKIGNSEAVNGLIAALNHSDSEVRIYAALASGKIGNSEAVNGLIAALNHSDSEVRSNAAEALGKIGNSEAVNSLIAALNHSNSEVRIYAAKALGNIGNSEAVNPLITSINDSDSWVRINAAWALGNIGNSEAVNPLIAALNDLDNEVRRNAASALGNIGNSEAVNPLIAALNDSYRGVRYDAASALGKIGNAETLKKLIEFLQINIYDKDIFPLARKLAVRYSKAKLPFIPVYPRLVRFKYSPLLAFVKRYRIKYKI